MPSVRYLQRGTWGARIIEAGETIWLPPGTPLSAHMIDITPVVTAAPEPEPTAPPEPEAPVPEATTEPPATEVPATTEPAEPAA